MQETREQRIARLASTPADTQCKNCWPWRGTIEDSAHTRANHDDVLGICDMPGCPCIAFKAAGTVDGNGDAASK